jgi:L-lactate dehydrogenase (cytochrome)
MRRLPPFLFQYVDGGAGVEGTLARNGADFQSVQIRQRVLTGVADPTLGIELFGQQLRLPIALAPVGLAGMYARRGETQAARAAAAYGIPFCLSTVSICSIEEVAAASKAPFWFQLYMIRDRGFMRDLLARARSAGCTTLVFTVDMPIPGVRYRDARSGLSGPHAALRRYLQAVTHPRWAWDVGLHGGPHTLGNLTPVLGAHSGLEDFIGWLGSNFDPTIRWKDLEWIRDLWDGPLLIKGVMEAEDAHSAVSLGADAVIVSNHGGRQLEGAASTIRVLPRIADSVGHRVKVLVDSGVRNGVDIFRALGLGADAALIGRPWVYALATAGESGVSRLLAMLERELRATMTLAGTPRVDAITADHLQLPELAQ